MNTARPRLLNTVHPRLLVEDFAKVFAFYEKALPELIGAEVAEGSAAGPYARWDVGEEQPALALVDQREMLGMLGDPATAEATSGVTVLIFRIANASAAQRICQGHGAELLSPAEERPQWGPDTHIAYVRDPAGNILELQSSPG